MANNRTDRPKPSVRRAAANGEVGTHAKGTSAAETLVTRRRFLYGAIGVGAAAAAGIGIAAAAGSGESGDEIPYLDAPASALSSLADFEALDSHEGSVQLVAEHDLPYGSLLWVNDESIAACLLPTETGSPLAQIGLLFLGSGHVDTVVEKAVGADDGFEVYDVRANSKGLVWTEANILQGSWRIYTAAIRDGVPGKPQLAEEGHDGFDAPMLAVSGQRAFWLANAKPVEEGDMPPSRLMAVPFGKTGAEAVYESGRRMASAPYGASDSVTIAPRVDSSPSYCQLTNLDSATGEVRDTLILPRAIAPVEAGYGPTGFTFSFPDIYDYDGAIANLGTYAPFSLPADGNYSNAQWFDFARTPTAAPAWCGDLLIVKSTYSVCGVDLSARTYFAIDVDNGADTYGEYLASTGTHDTFVTYTNIDHEPIGSEKVHTCRVKVWEALPPGQQVP